MGCHRARLEELKARVIDFKLGLDHKILNEDIKVAKTFETFITNIPVSTARRQISMGIGGTTSYQAVSFINIFVFVLAMHDEIREATLRNRTGYDTTARLQRPRSQFKRRSGEKK
ncbi:hypothetical protein EVAR_12082_1 [Eumeta japonica]|uniref:Uncharacterized protein n=1 Tax=Eumeta variegata TaxID=151549 RepID=A0A4C1U582_EUMVA|nr:hypothetical protein EVAR_12082_1 [Eumeta japonica]